MCHVIKSNTAADVNSNNVIVFGASGFLGSKIASKFQLSQFKVLAVEDVMNRFINQYTWYRWDKLAEQGFAPRYLNTSSNSELSTVLDECKSGTIVYVPSLIFDGSANKSRLPLSLTDSSSVLANFVSLLELVATKYKNKFHVMLISLSNEAGLSIQKAWLTALEVSLSSYQGMYELQSSIIKTNGLYGIWQNPLVQHGSLKCLSVDSFVEHILDVLKKRNDPCTVQQVTDCSDNHDIYDNTGGLDTDMTDTTTPRKNVIMSTYFTKKGNSMYAITPDRFYFLKQWFLSARKFGVFIVIIHDQLSQEFQDRVKAFYPSVDFVKEDTLDGWSANDGRFYIEYDYILKHPEIKRVLMTDLRDVKLFADPFKVMDTIGDYMYVGIDVTYLIYSYELDWIRNIFDVCSKHEDHSFLELHPFLNAGVLGGTRHAMLSYLTLMNRYLKTTPKFNCNMAAINFVTNKFYHQESYSGYPLQQGFKMGIAPSRGLAVKHKDTGELDH